VGEARRRASAQTAKVTLTCCKNAKARVITLQNPTSRNAMNRAMMVELERAVRTLEQEGAAAADAWAAGNTSAVFTAGRGLEYRSVILHGAAGAFCSGADLSALEGMRGEPAARGAANGGAGLADGGGESLREFGRWMHSTMTGALGRLRALPQVSVSLVEGPAVGGGAELMTATDLRVWGHGSRARFAQASMGVSPGWGGAARLRAIVGEQAARHLLLTGRWIGAEEASAAGLCDASTEEDGEDGWRPGPLDAAGERSCPGCVAGTCSLDASGRRSVARLLPDDAPVSALAACKASLAGDESAAFLGVWGGRAQQGVLDRVAAARTADGV